jgi:outer membrane receptor for ferrienterochelin and colicins
MAPGTAVAMGGRNLRSPMRRHVSAPAKWGLLLALLTVPRAAAGDVQHELLLFEEIPITAATKHAQPSRTAPANVTVITREDIDRFGYRTLAEALRAQPGFYLSGDRASDHIGVRGFLRPNDFNDRILLLVNGHTYNNDIYQQAYVGQDFGIDLEAVDHIEVIRGPGSALYGGNAFFAVVNVVTLTGSELPGVHALAETGSFWRKRGQASVGHVTSGGAEIFASGSVLDVDGQDELFYPAYDSPKTNFGIAENADAERALKFFGTARWGAFSIQGGTSWREKHIPTAAYFTTFNDPGTKSVDARQFAEVAFRPEPVARTDVSARLFYDAAQYHGTYIYGTEPDRVKNEDKGTSHWFGGEVQARRELFRNNSATIGTEFTYHPDPVQSNFDLPSNTVFLDVSDPFNTVGVYAQDEWQPLSQLSLVGGLRWDRYYNRIQQVSPRFAAIWSATERTTVKLLFGQAFRPPNLYEQFYAYPSVGVRAIANPSLDAEHITTYEGVVEQDLWGRAQATAAVYHYRIRDLIEQVDVPDAGFAGQTLQFQNVGSAKATGGEFELKVPLPRGVVWRSYYNVQEALDRNGQLLSNSPKHLGTLGLYAPLPYGLEAATELILVGPRKTLGGSRLETVHVLNVNLLYETPIRDLGFSAGFYNILNQTYPDPGGTEHRQDRIPQDGFTFRVQLRYAF